MKIVIAGAGAVGTHLARLLSKENHNIVLIDPDEDKLSKLNSELDIMTLGVSPTSITGLRNAGIEGTDLFIAVTPHESENITCCMIAKQLGASRTVARIDNYEYLEDTHKAIFDSAGINMLIYPEMLAGKEIAASAEHSWVRQWWDFDGDLVLLSIKLHRNQPNAFAGKTLREIGASGHQFHFVCIKRSGQTIIPGGDEVIRPEDLVFVMTKKEEIHTLRTLAGKDGYPHVKHVMIIGGGKLAVRADWAMNDSMAVKIIESDPLRCEQLGRLTKDRTLIINGDCYDIDMLRDEGYDKLEAFIALTGNDEENILACVAARRNGIRKTIAQVENLAYLDMAEALDVGTIINKKMVAASHIYTMLLKADVENVKMLTVANADVAEFVVKEGSSVTRHPIRDIGIPRDVTLGGLVRDGRGMLISGNTQLRAGDKVVVFCRMGNLKKLDKYFR